MKDTTINTIFKTTLLTLFLIAFGNKSIHAGEISPLEQMKALKKQAKKQADEHTAELTRLQIMFNKEKKPKKRPFFPKSRKYKKKHRTVAADLKEFNQALQNDISKLLAPLPSTPTKRDFQKYRDLLISFGNNATRTFKALRDEMKWLRGKRKAKFEVFLNYKTADKFLSNK